MRKANCKILVIDDEPEITRAVRLTISLQVPEWQVFEAHTGPEGLEQLARLSPDLVLLDLSMPGMHGFDVLKEIRLTSAVPVIFLTVQDDELSKVRGLELGSERRLDYARLIPESTDAPAGLGKTRITERSPFVE